MSALAIFEKLKGIDVSSLSPLQRIMLITDGTLTEILEAHFLEPIQLIKLSQQTLTASATHRHLMPNAKETLLERKIILRGVKSEKNYVYAESVIAFERLDPLFRDQLLNSDVSLGRLWLEYKLETYKELLEIRCQDARELSQHLKCKESDKVLTRTYRVFSNAKPIIIISEYFATA